MKIRDVRAAWTIEAGKWTVTATHLIISTEGGSVRLECPIGGEVDCQKPLTLVIEIPMLQPPE